MNINFNLDALPKYRSEYHLPLQEYCESFMTENRISILKQTLEKRMNYITLVAENFIDEFNVHAMIRSSECFGLQDFHNIGQKNVILKPNKSVNRGSFQWTHIYDYSDCENPTLDCIQNLKSKGYRVFCTSSHLPSSFTPENIPIDQPLAIMMGKEKEGISSEAIEHCDGLVTIPMYGFTESFNVSVAGALILQPIVERIRRSDIDWAFDEKKKRDLYYEWVWNSVRRPDILYKDWCVNNSVVPNL